jgi:hypothetical protein
MDLDNSLLNFVRVLISLIFYGWDCSCAGTAALMEKSSSGDRDGFEPVLIQIKRN